MQFIVYKQMCSKMKHTQAYPSLPPHSYISSLPTWYALFFPSWRGKGTFEGRMPSTKFCSGATTHCTLAIHSSYTGFSWEFSLLGYKLCVQYTHKPQSMPSTTGCPFCKRKICIQNRSCKSYILHKCIFLMVIQYVVKINKWQKIDCFSLHYQKCHLMFPDITFWIKDSWEGLAVLFWSVSNPILRCPSLAGIFWSVGNSVLRCPGISGNEPCRFPKFTHYGLKN